MSGRRRALVIIAVAMIICGLVVVAGLIHVHGLGDVAVGTGTSYCGWAAHSHSIEFYCQSGQ